MANEIKFQRNPTTKVSSEKVINPDGSVSYIFTKRCPHCHKTYTTTSRRQKFCSDECAKKYSTSHIKSRRQYASNAEYERVRSRAHSLSRAVFDLLVSAGLRENSCELCGSTSKLHVHHINLNFLDNSPENLQCLCEKCHNKVHSELDASLKSEDKTRASLFPHEELSHIMSHLNNYAK